MVREQMKNFPEEITRFTDDASGISVRVYRVNVRGFNEYSISIGSESTTGDGKQYSRVRVERQRGVLDVVFVTDYSYTILGLTEKAQTFIRERLTEDFHAWLDRKREREVQSQGENRAPRRTGKTDRKKNKKAGQGQSE